MKNNIRSAVLTITTAACVTFGAVAPAQAEFTVNKVWSYNHNTPTPTSPATGRSSEILALDAPNSALWVIGGNGIDVLDLNGALLRTLNTTALGYGQVNSVAIRGDVAAVAFSNGTNVTQPGTVQFFSASGFLSGNTTPLGGVNVGAVPDMVTWAPDGRLLVANEGERQSDANNPVGGVSIITYNAPTPSASTVDTAGFGAFDGTSLPGVRLQPGVAPSVGLEPEYIAVNGAGTKALVTLQESNAFGILNLTTNAFDKVVSLGTKDFNVAGNGIDPSDQDSTKLLRNVPVKGLYMPDAVVSYVAKNGKTYYVTANEGDTFIEDTPPDATRINAISNANFDPTVFTAAEIAAIKANTNLGRLNISTLDGRNAAGQYQQLFAFGGRSFSIWDEDGKLVKDSGDTIERELLARFPALYADNRSDDKGVEPEGIAIKEIGDRIYAFIGLERTGQSVIAIFDITDPENPVFVQFITSGTAAEFRPEGLLAFERNGMFYLAVAQEADSNITTLYSLTPVPEPSTYALLGAGLLALGYAARRRRNGPAAA